MTDTETLKISTTRFGELEVARASIIRVLGGLIGFAGLENFVLLEYNTPFSWLQSVDRSDLAFVVVDGGEFGESYRFPIPKDDSDLAIVNDTDVAIVNLVSVRSDPSLTTVNMKAPIVVNLVNRYGRQIVLDNPNFPVRMPLWASGNKSDTKTP